MLRTSVCFSTCKFFGIYSTFGPCPCNLLLVLVLPSLQRNFYKSENARYLRHYRSKFLDNCSVFVVSACSLLFCKTANSMVFAVLSSPALRSTLEFCNGARLDFASLLWRTGRFLGTLVSCISGQFLHSVRLSRHVWGPTPYTSGQAAPQEGLLPVHIATVHIHDHIHDSHGSHKLLCGFVVVHAAW